MDLLYYLTCFPASLYRIYCFPLSKVVPLFIPLTGQIKVAEENLNGNINFNY